MPFILDTEDLALNALIDFTKTHKKSKPRISFKQLQMYKDIIVQKTRSQGIDIYITLTKYDLTALSMHSYFLQFEEDNEDLYILLTDTKIKEELLSFRSSLPLEIINILDDKDVSKSLD